MDGWLLGMAIPAFMAGLTLGVPLGAWAYWQGARSQQALTDFFESEALRLAETNLNKDDVIEAQRLRLQHLQQGRA